MNKEKFKKILLGLLVAYGMVFAVSNGSLLTFRWIEFITPGMSKIFGAMPEAGLAGAIFADPLIALVSLFVTLLPMLAVGVIVYAVTKKHAHDKVGLSMFVYTLLSVLYIYIL